MTNPESRPAYKEVDGEVLPSYTGVNAPKYPRGEARDTEAPHDYVGDGPMNTSQPESATTTADNGFSIPLDHRDHLLIQSMNKWAEANQLEGVAKGMQTRAHRARLGADDEFAGNSATKAQRLRSEARDAFEAATGIYEMDDDTGEVSPEVLVLSFFQDFKTRFLADKSRLDKRRKLHRSNMQKRA